MKKCKHAADVKVENSVTIKFCDLSGQMCSNTDAYKCNCYEEEEKDKDV